MAEPDPVEQIKYRAIGLLARREHSRRELRHKLKQKMTDMEPAQIEQALLELAAEGHQSDTRFAEEYVYHRMNKGYGPVRIRAELQERGIDDALVRQAFAEQYADWSQLAVEARSKRFGQTEIASLAERAKQTRFLLQRGFPADVVARCVPSIQN